MGGLGGGASTFGGQVLHEVGRAAAHGMVQGSLSAMQGGSFKNGFASGGLGSISGSGFQVMDPNFGKSAWNNTFIGVLSGGMGAELSGGNFWRGAGQGATVALLNHYAHEGAESLEEKWARRQRAKAYAEQAFSGISLSGSERQTLFLMGAGLANDGASEVLKFFQKGNVGVKAAAIRNLMPTDAIDGTIGKTSRLLTTTKWIGRSFVILGSASSVYDGYLSYQRGDVMGVHKAGLDLGMGLFSAYVGGIPGVIMYGGYMIIFDPSPYKGPGYQAPNVVRRDNTYVAPPIY